MKETDKEPEPFRCTERQTDRHAAGRQASSLRRQTERETDMGYSKIAGEA
jgi:hypothetical protein